MSLIRFESPANCEPPSTLARKLAWPPCSHVILENEVVEIPDTLADPRLCDNPLCLDDDGLRFYVGALLVSSEGLPIGTLCVLDRVAQQINTVALLHDQLSHNGADQIDLAPYLSCVTVLAGGAHPAGARISGRFDPLLVLARDAALLGTVVNELVANAIQARAGQRRERNHADRRGAR